MNFTEQVRAFSDRIERLMDSIHTEEATKTAIVMPFFAMLGYDVFDPNEFAPEFTADVGIKKGEKVDYAILFDGKPTILVEVKNINNLRCIYEINCVHICLLYISRIDNTLLQ